MIAGRLVAICVSEGKGQQKRPLPRARLIAGHGVEGDAHAGRWHRQVSLLADEQVDRMRAQGLSLGPGDFGENMLTRGIAREQLPVGRRLRVGDDVVLQVTQIGKRCHTRCAIYEQAGDCIMPTTGVFCRVCRGGLVAPGAAIRGDEALDRLRYAVVTLSDRRSAAHGAPDEAGDAARRLLAEALPDALLVERLLLPDQQASIERELLRLCDDALCDLIVTTGGTGLAPRDVTPEATRAVIDREVPGIAEAMRAAGLAHTPHAMLSRAVCGQRGAVLIVNLSGSPKAVREQLGVLLPALPHALAVASGRPQDCARDSR